MISWEPLSRQVSVAVSEVHRFNTDTILLAAFSLPKKGWRCADFGSGCGAIPLIWLARSAPQQVCAVELQQDACQLLRLSAEQNQLSSRFSVLNLDLRTIPEQRSHLTDLQELDLIACNPPYKADGSGYKNPHDGRRVARHEDECTVEDVCRAAASVLKFGGRLCLCQRPERLCDVLQAMRAFKIEPKRLRFVQQRPGKEPSLFLVQGALGRQPGLRVEPALMIEENGNFSREMMDIYGDYKEGR